MEYRRRRRARKLARTKIEKADKERKDFETVLKELDTVLALEERKKSSVCVDEKFVQKLKRRSEETTVTEDNAAAKDEDGDTRSIYMVFETEEIRKSRNYAVNSMYKV